MKFNRLFCVMILVGIMPFFAIGQVYERTDTLFIPDISDLPVIDGLTEDEVWQKTEWHNIGEIWMPYNNESSNLAQSDGLQLWEDELDFTGRYKLVWSKQTNLLYVLAEITDDVFVDGYVYNENPSGGGGYPNYDILEIFIDADRSGGLHVFDGSGNVANNWGSNAENAFSYHIAVNAPDDGEVQDQFHALDIAGSNWGYPNQKVADYAGHFPGFAMKRNDNTYIWEFSLEVHNANYNSSNPQASVVSLENGNIFGLSVAYCDNDDPGENPPQRDHFFGSVYVPLSAHNDHWKDADWFGVAKLTDDLATASPGLRVDDAIKMNSYCTNRKLNLSIQSPANGKISVRVMNILGKEMLNEEFYKTSGQWSRQTDLAGWQSGVYLVEIVHGSKRVAEKIIVQ